ncbi:acyl dehydratase [Blastococcus colisei]|uniref:Acyl dehydratase n=1 Tax=Blastococcus colisei TaxID=1564162 RepID=A0A543P210_9ACTN|nr:MaoC family dehydratase [Blastococcus colisei]TQN38109.1 acyl dehydratase [Blastococcus colisei]
MAQTTVEGIEGVQGLVGQHLGYSDWVEITQGQVNRFAEATGDHQWIHVDPERAKKESPFGGPIAHGYLTLSLIPSLMPQIIEITGFRMGVNYGTEKVRFPSPVPVGARVRAGATLEAATPFEGGIAMNLGVTMEIDGGTKPAMVATVVYRRYL